MLLKFIKEQFDEMKRKKHFSWKFYFKIPYIGLVLKFLYELLTLYLLPGMTFHIFSALSSGSRQHLCGHVRSTEAKVAQSDLEFLLGINLPQWTRQDDELEDQGADDNVVIGVREYQKYAEIREVLFAMFPQVGVS